MTAPFLPAPLALFGNLDVTEILVIALFAVMIFGRRLPRVAAQVVTKVTRARKALQEVWRESGIGDEIRQVQREIERGDRSLRSADPTRVASNAMREIEAEVRRPAPSPKEEGTPDPDADRALEDQADEPPGERSRVPSWYPKTLQPPSSADFEEDGGVPSGPGVSPGGLMPRPQVEEPAAASAEETDLEEPGVDDPRRERGD